MTILFLTHFYPPEMGAAANRASSFARWLTKYGHEVTIITGLPNYPVGIVAPEYRGRRRVEERVDGVRVVRTRVYASPRRGNFTRLAGYLVATGSSTIAGLKAGRGCDVVLASSPPLFLGLAGWILARRHNVPFVFDIRDLWPEVAVEAGEFPVNSALTRCITGLARFLYRQADHLTVVTQRKLDALSGHGVPTSKMTLVANGVDIAEVKATSHSRLRNQLGLDGKFVVLYAGLIGLAQGVGIAIEAAAVLRQHRDIRFVIAGDGVRRINLLARIKELGLENVILLPLQSRADMPELLAAADACLALLVSSSLQGTIPTKLFEAWAYEKPVILAAAGEAAELVEYCHGGIVVMPGEANQLAEAVLQLKGNPAQAAGFGRDGCNYVRKNCDRKDMARQMEAALLKQIERRSDG